MANMTGVSQFLWALLLIFIGVIADRVYNNYFKKPKTLDENCYDPKESLTNKISGSTFTFGNVNEKISPVLLSYDDAKFKKWKELPIDLPEWQDVPVSKKLIIAGDVVLEKNSENKGKDPVFEQVVKNADHNGKKLVPEVSKYFTFFKRSVKLQFTFPKETPNEKLIVQDTSDYSPIAVPVFLSDFEINGVVFQVWKPFQDYEIDYDNKTVSITFKFWGDRPVGIVIFDAPKNFGPP